MRAIPVSHDMSTGASYQAVWRDKYILSVTFKLSRYPSDITVALHFQFFYITGIPTTLAYGLFIIKREECP